MSFSTLKHSVFIFNLETPALKREVPPLEADVMIGVRRMNEKGYSPEIVRKVKDFMAVPSSTILDTVEVLIDDAETEAEKGYCGSALDMVAEASLLLGIAKTLRRLRDTADGFSSLYEFPINDERIAQLRDALERVKRKYNRLCL